MNDLDFELTILEKKEVRREKGIEKRKKRQEERRDEKGREGSMEESVGSVNKKIK